MGVIQTGVPKTNPQGRLEKLNWIRLRQYRHVRNPAEHSGDELLRLILHIDATAT